MGRACDISIERLLSNLMLLTCVLYSLQPCTSIAPSTLHLHNDALLPSWRKHRRTDVLYVPAPSLYMRCLRHGLVRRSTSKRPPSALLLRLSLHETFTRDVQNTRELHQLVVPFLHEDRHHIVLSDIASLESVTSSNRLLATRSADAAPR